jgi:hypothetical protein
MSAYVCLGKLLQHRSQQSDASTSTGREPE